MSYSKPAKRKVLFIMHLPPPVHGAAMAGLYIQSSLIINAELSTTYVNLATNSQLNTSGKWTSQKFAPFVRILRQIITNVRRSKFDICHVSLTASGPGFYKDFVVVMLLKILRQKIIFHFHNKGVAMASEKRLNRLLYRLTFKNTQSILLSPYLYRDIEMYVKREDVYYCPYGIPLQERSDKKLAVRSVNTCCRILYLSNMMSQKGVYVLLEALELIQKRGVSFECHFVGAWSDISEETFKSEIAKRGLSDVVFAHGPKYADEKLPFFNSSDIFVFPTHYHYETFGIVNLEAMQHELPIVSTFEGGIPDVVIDGETGFLVPQRDSTMLSYKLEKLINDPGLRKQMGSAGKARYLRHFTLSSFESNFSQILIDASSSN